jgi:integrase/recombinase XerD
MNTKIKEYRILEIDLLTYIDSWLSDLDVTKHRKPSTITFYREKITPFIRYIADRGVSIDAIDHKLIRDFLALIKPLHNDGGNHAIYRVVRAFFYWYGADIDLDISKNPIRKIKMPIPKPPRGRTYSIEEIERLFSVSKNIRDKALIRFLYDTGGRIGEILAMNISDYDVATGRVVFVKTKNGEFRFQRVGQITRREMRRYINSRADDNPCLWISQAGNRLTYRGARDVMQSLFSNAKVKFNGFHPFRRAWTSAMVSNNTNIYALQVLGGWKDPKTPQRYTEEFERNFSSNISPVDNLKKN